MHRRDIFRPHLTGKVAKEASAIFPCVDKALSPVLCLSRLVPKVNRILIAMRAGTKTTGEIARAVRLNRSTTSVALRRLADREIIERAGLATVSTPGAPLRSVARQAQAPRAAPDSEANISAA